MAGTLLHIVLLFQSLLVPNFSDKKENIEIENEKKVSFHHYGIEEGLSHTSVFSIQKDSFGYMWFGTSSGISRYNGYEFLNIKEISIDNHPEFVGTIWDIVSWHEGDLWLVSQLHGLLYYDAGREDISCYAPDDNINQRIRDVSAIYNTDDDQLILGTNEGVVITLDPDNSAFEILTYIPGGNNQIHSIVKDQWENLWIGTTGGLFRYDPANEQLEHMTDRFVDQSVEKSSMTRCLVENKNELWAGTHNGIFNLRINASGIGDVTHYAQESQNEEFQIPHNIVHSMTFDNDGNLLAGTGKGVLRITEEKVISYQPNSSDPSSLNDRYIYDVYFDPSENLWVGTYFGGVNVHYRFMPGYDVVSEDLDGKGLRGRIVKCFMENDNELWVGTEDAGISIFDAKKNTWQYLAEKNGLPNDNVQTMMKDSKGRIWIGLFRGGLTMIDSTEKFHFFNQSGDKDGFCPSDVISFIREDKDGNIWAGTLNRGLTRYDEKTGNFILVPPHNNVNVNGMVEVDEELFFSTINGGLLHLDKERMKTQRIIIEGGTVRAHTIFSKGDKVWLGTFGDGLLIGEFVNGKFVIEEKYFPLTTVNSIVEDQNDNVWISTNTSFFQMDKDRGIKKSFYQHHGLQNTFNRDAGMCLKSGKIAFGGLNGYSIITPDIIEDDFKSTNLIINDLYFEGRKITTGSFEKILEKPMAKTESLNLKHNQNNFTLRFVSLQFASKKSEEYYYRMTGFIDEWISNGEQRSVTFNNLKPGEYVFEVGTREMISDHQYGEIASVAITVEPPWWLTTYAYVGYFVLFVLFLFGFKRYSVRKLKEKNALQIEQMKRRKEKEIYESKLDFFTNVSHEIRTPLTLIIGPLEEYIKHVKNQQDTITLNIIRKNATRLLQLINQILDFRKYDKKGITLNYSRLELLSVLYNVKELFIGAAKQKALKISINTSLDSLYVEIDKTRMEEVFFNLISNAMKYCDQGGNIDINVKYNSPQEGLIIEFVDSGSGISYQDQKYIFTPFYSGSGQGTRFNTGIGLSLVKEIIDLHGGTITVDSVSEEGTKFKIVLPSNIVITNDFQQPSLETYNEGGKNSLDLTTFHENDEGQFGDYQNKKCSSEKDDKDKPLVLVVEDNPELRSFICESLSEKHQVSSSPNGMEGLKMARELVPDLIITDIGMPEMDGVELCKSLKSDFLTSSIPVIILTVYNSFDKQMKGVEAGADIYLTKPFQADLLREWVHNLLQQRARVTEKIRQGFLTNPDNLEFASEEDSFIVEMKKIMEEKMDDSEFNVDELAERLGVSRTAMYRKFKQIVGISPKDFIRQSRLNRAAQLLRAGNMSIAEITYAVGYNDLKYFRTSFCKQFGVNPSDYRKRMEDYSESE